MSEILQIILFLLFGIPLIFWIISAGSGWQKLAARYATDCSVPDAFYLESDRRIIFKSESISGNAALTQLGIGVLDEGLYLTMSAIPLVSDLIFPPLLIPWNDISYRRNTSNSSSSIYFTFYLGNPRITSFSLNQDTIARLEADYGEPIFLNKLGEPN